MSLARRGQQWLTMAPVWHLFDIKWQDPFLSAPLIIKYLKGMYKPIYHEAALVGDHVIVINTKDIALRGDDWTKRVYFHHNTYHSGDSWVLAWELHKKNRTMIVQKAVYHAMRGNLQRRHNMQRMHLFEDDKVPEEMLANVCNQIKPLRTVPTRLDHIPEEEVENFPRIVKLPETHIPR